MTAEVQLDWADLKSLPRWTRLRQVTTGAVHLGDDLFKIGPGKYLICVPYNRDMQEQVGDRFVTVWFGPERMTRRCARS